MEPSNYPPGVSGYEPEIVEYAETDAERHAWDHEMRDDAPEVDTLEGSSDDE